MMDGREAWMGKKTMRGAGIGAKKMKMEVLRAWEWKEKGTCVIASNEKLNGSTLIKRLPSE